YKGRTTAMRLKSEVAQLLADDISQRKIAAQLNISLSSVQRIVKQLKQDDPL
ncbi:helix-turn-helix domain-containing protein, partial [Vibrio parahaemolyticus]|nr:helix-turn-helix domain-containing protein [Vibrio parahaemolyticus]